MINNTALPRIHGLGDCGSTTFRGFFPLVIYLILRIFTGFTPGNLIYFVDVILRDYKGRWDKSNIDMATTRWVY